MKGRQLCNVIWKFVEDIFTYQNAPFENICDWQFSCKFKSSNFLGGISDLQLAVSTNSNFQQVSHVTFLSSCCEYILANT